MEEIWGNVPEYENYQVSNLGRILSFYFKEKKILKPKKNKKGYYTVALYNAEKRKNRQRHGDEELP